MPTEPLQKHCNHIQAHQKDGESMQKREKGMCQDAGNLPHRALWVSMETVDLNAWMHKAFLPGVPYWFGGQKITFP